MSTIEIILSIVSTFIAVSVGSAIPWIVSVSGRLGAIDASLRNGMHGEIREIKVTSALQYDMILKMHDRLSRIEEREKLIREMELDSRDKEHSNLNN